MHWLPDKIISTARDAKALAGRLMNGSVEFLRGTVGALPLFTSARVHQIAGILHDETHYLLVPLRTAPDGYAVNVQRVIPDGHGLDNDLPKQRIFHLPAHAARERIEAILTADLTCGHYDPADAESDLAPRLDRIADEIDRQSNRVSGGLLIIGGAVAIANPLLGVAIAAKALIPSLGSKITHEAMKLVGKKLRASAQRGAQRDAEKKAVADIQRLTPVIRINPLLAHLDAALAGDDPAHDPYPETPDDTPDHALTARAIVHCYVGILDDPPAAARLHAPDIAWLRWLARGK